MFENKVHRVRDGTFAEVAGQVRKGAEPQALTALRNGVLSLLRALDWTNIADAVRHYGAYAHPASDATLTQPYANPSPFLTGQS